MNILRSRCLKLLAAVCSLVLLLTACAVDSNTPEQSLASQSAPLHSSPAPPSLLQGLPVDARQPWEQAAAQPAPDLASRGLSALDANSEFMPGVERFNEGGNVADLGEASRLQSGAAGSGESAWAMYRLPLPGSQPGALAFDVNLRARSDNSPSQYYLGLSNYEQGRWEWHGPYSDHHVRLAHGASAGPDVFSDGAYTSPLENLFLTVLVSAGSSVDILGISADTLQAADQLAPDVPQGLTAGPLTGGLALQWNDVIAGDLVGYRIYYSTRNFSSSAEAGVNSASYVEGSTRHILAGLSGLVFVRISAIDSSGNESALSDVVSASALPGSGPGLILSVSAPSVLRDAAATLELLGETDGLSFDYDLDGDGVFELSGQPAGPQLVDTGRAGIIRPRVHAVDGLGEREALGGVSLLVVANMRPVASALADPQSGSVPLLVDFDGSVSTDFDGTISGGGWDFDGDGIFDLYDESSTADLSGQFLYETAGLYNAKLRVIDDQGSWDVDTISIFVAAPGVNLPPQITQITASPAMVAPLQNIDFSTEASDPDGSVDGYAWDFDNDGTDDDSGKAPSHAFGTAGVFNVRLTVTDNAGATDTDYVVVLVQGDPIDQAPVIHLQPSEPIQLLGKTNAPLTIHLSAGGSYDPEGGSLSYAWDLFGTGSFSGFTPDVSVSVNYNFNSPGVYNPAVRVQDQAGNISQASCIVSVYRLSPSVTETGYSQANSTAITALQSSNSRLIGVAYYDSGNDDLRFMRSVDQLGNSWLPSYVVDANGAEWISLAQGASQFNMAYYRDGDLFFKASQNDGNSFNVSGTVDNTADDAGNYCSCAVVAGFPAVSYYNATIGDLYFLRASNTGSSWGTPVAVDGTGDTGQYTSMTFVNGNPAIAYYRADIGNLMYVRANNNTGSSWGSPITVDASANDVGKFASLAVISGSDGARPAIAYWDANSNLVLYRRASDANGTSWGNAVTAMNANASALSLRQVTGHAMVAASIVTSVGVSFNLSSDDVGSAWGSSTQIEGDNAGTLMSASVMPNGMPVLAYYDSGAFKELHVALPKLD